MYSRVSTELYPLSSRSSARAVHVHPVVVGGGIGGRWSGGYTIECHASPGEPTVLQANWHRDGTGLNRLRSSLQPVCCASCAFKRWCCAILDCGVGGRWSCVCTTEIKTMVNAMLADKASPPRNRRAAIGAVLNMKSARYGFKRAVYALYTLCSRSSASAVQPHPDHQPNGGGAGGMGG